MALFTPAAKTIPGLPSSAVEEASKKSKRRKKKGKSEGSEGGSKPKKEGHTAESLLPRIKEELEKAKEAKDHTRASKLRQQLWVLTDIVNGVNTDIPEEDLRPILESLSLLATDENAEKTTKTEKKVVSGEDKAIQKLKKKLKQIEALKERAAKGEKLDKMQLEKINTEDDVRKEMTELEEFMKTLMSNKETTPLTL